MQEQTTRSSRTPWKIAFLLGLGVLINYLDRVNLSVAHDALHARFGTTDVTFGYLLSAYSWTYAAMQMPSGSLLDRFGVRRVMLVAVFLWAIASGIAALAPTIGILLAARFLLGIGEAPTFPANSKAIALWFPAQRRGIPTAMFDTAAKFSIGVSTPFLAAVLLAFGLRVTFATTAVLSLGYALLFVLLYREPQQHEAPHHEAALSPEDAPTFASLLSYKKVWGAALGAGATNYCFYLLLTWLPYYLQQSLKINPRTAALWSAIPWIVAAITGFLIGGRLVDSSIRKGRDSRQVRRTILLIGTGFGLFVAGPAFTHSAPLVLLCLTLALCGITTASPVAWTLPALLAPSRGVGRLGAIMNLAGQIAAITAPIATGYIGGRTHSLDGAFAVAGVALAVSFCSYALLLGKIERIGEPVAN